jgi:hypothetical protein
MYQVLSATSATLRAMILNAMTSDVGPTGIASFFTGTRDVSLLTPHEMREAHQEGVSLWLYSVQRDEERLNDPARTHLRPDGQVELVPTPLPLRLHYLITPLADGAPDMEQRMLGRAMQALHSHAIIGGALLQGELAGTDAELHVHLESLALDQIARVWEALEGSYQLCVSYEVSLARIEPDLDPMRASPVETVRADAALIVAREPAL